MSLSIKSRIVLIAPIPEKTFLATMSMWLLYLSLLIHVCLILVWSILILVWFLIVNFGLVYFNTIYKF